MYHAPVRRPLVFLFWLFAFSAFLGLFYWGLHMRYPDLGHDYFLFYPRLLAGRWHFLQQGLTPFYFSPHLCGGMPQWGNPHEMFYSLPQMLVIAGVDLWQASQLSMLFALCVGYWGWFRFGHDVLLLKRGWAHVLTFIILANGFYLIHMLVGHLIFHGLPMMGVLLWLVFDRNNAVAQVRLPALVRRDSRISPAATKINIRIPVAARIAIFALVTAYILYSGGFFILFATALACLVMLPMDLLSHHPQWKERLKIIITRAVTFGIAAVLICLAKLAATFSLMQAFPRHIPFDRLAGGNVLWFIAKAFWALPQTVALFVEEMNKSWGSVHEYSMAVSPIVLVGLFIGLILLLVYRKSLQSHRKLSLLWTLYGIFLLILFTDIARGHGPIITWFENAPFMSAQHVTQRFLYVFALLLTGVSVWCLQRAFAHFRRPRLESFCIGCSVLITFASLFAAYWPLLATDHLGLTMPYDRVIKAMAAYDGFLERPVNAARNWKAQGQSDLQHVFEGSTGIECYEPLFWGSGNIEYPKLQEAPVYFIYDDAFNIYNPACFIYPSANNCAPGDRIAVSDEDNLERFVRGQKTSWIIPWWQRVANVISVLSLLVFVLILCRFRCVSSTPNPSSKGGGE